MTAALWALRPALVAQTLYDIKFDTPDQGVNQVVVVRHKQHYVSEIVFGAPEVVSSFGGLTDQPLRFDRINLPAGDPYDQIELGLSDGGWRTLDLSFDFTSLGLIGTANNLTLNFDTPVGMRGMNNLVFRNDGLISHLQPNQYQFEPPFGSFTDGETFRVRIHFDFTLGLSSTYKDGVRLEESPIGGASYLEGIRFSYGQLSDFPSPDSSAVAIDNILVEVPEPGCLTRLAMVIALVAAWCRKRLARQSDGKCWQCAGS